MKKRFFRWLDIKKTENGILTSFLKIIYHVGLLSCLHAILSAVCGIAIPIMYDTKHYVLFCMSLILLIVDIIYVNICNSYKTTMFMQRKFSAEVLADQSSLLKSIIIYAENNKHWQNNIFSKTSELVCEKIYRIFKEVFNCKIRIAVEYTFYENNKKGKSTKYVKMAGRRSKSRATVKKASVLNKRKKYHSCQIFMDNKSGNENNISILNREEISDDNIWYKNPEHNIDIEKYIGIAVKVYGESEVRFILEIDFLNNFVFGDTKEEISQFTNHYIVPYINILTMSYILNLDKDRKIHELDVDKYTN